MELYTLNEQFQRDEVVEGYNSLVWTERYSAYGDFVLVTNATRAFRTLLPEGTYLGLDKSHRVMKVETVENKTAEDGTALLTITGRSLEACFEDRTAMPALAGLSTTPKWDITGTPGAIARELFDTICVDLALDPGDGIPFYTPGAFLDTGSIPEPVDVVTISFDPDTLYNSIKKVCDVYNLGFRLVRKGDESELYFDIYTGDDRTSAQSTFDAVIFSPDLDNLTSTTELTSSAAVKTVALVFALNGTATVYAVGTDPAAAGFKRRVLLVKADDIDLPAGEELDAALQQKGLEELSKCQRIFGFDGEISAAGGYEYDVHYSLGDLVEQRDDDGFGTIMRVTEQIFVSDEQGERSYPTLSINLTVNPGSWYSWNANEVWDEVDDEADPESYVYWANA